MYEELAQFFGLSLAATVALLIAVSLVDIVLRGFALWFSAGKKQKIWFVCLLIFNTIGILPLIYLLIHKPWGKKAKAKKKK